MPLLAISLLAAPTPDHGRARIITADELAKTLATVSVLDAREEKDFRAGHAPGSRNVDWKDYTLEKPGAWSLLAGDPARWGKLPLLDETLSEHLRALGLSNEKTVVVVGDPSGWGEEGRIAWLLLTFGARDVALLDGGFPAWKASGRPLETGAARPVAPGSFTARLDPVRRIEIDPLASVAARKSRPLLDARSTEEFHGEKMKGQKRGGHLPGASLVTWRSLYRKDGCYVDAGELRRLLPPSATRTAPVTYCTGGVRSALLAFLIEARLGIRPANYDGSMWEWSADPSRPLVPS